MEDCVMIADGATGGGVREFVRACVCMWKMGDKETKEWCVYRGIREQRGIVGLSQEKEIWNSDRAGADACARTVTSLRVHFNFALCLSNVWRQHTVCRGR